MVRRTRWHGTTPPALDHPRFGGGAYRVAGRIGSGSAGTHCEGPGEFIRSITHFSRLRANSLLARDGGGRTMVFGPDGTYARLLRLAEPTEGIGQSRVIGALGDGTLVATYNELVASNGEIPTGVMRGPERVGLLDSGGAVDKTLGEFRSQESIIRVSRGASGEISSIEVRRLTMGRSSVFAVGANSVVAGETDRLELVRYDAAGSSTTIVRVATPLTLLSGNARQQTLDMDSNAVRTLHKKMFAQTWTWAGIYRTSEKSISRYSWAEVPRLVRDLLANTQEQFEVIKDSAEALDQLAARFHRQLVLIHPWPNGNGRHARLATDLLLQRWGRPLFTWGSRSNHADGAALRRSYLTSLRDADAGRFEPLERFVRS